LSGAKGFSMKIRAGYEISYECPQPTPMILTLSVHPSRFSDLLTPDRMRLDPPIPANTYHDSFGNFCHVIRAPAGRLTFSTDFLVEDKGEPDATAPQAEQHALEDLPVEALIYLLGSRYCETDRLSNMAWSLFGQVRKGWPLVKAICDYVHDRITFSYAHASPTKTAFDAYTEKWGVCRDFAHLAVTLCRCMNVPARYCTGYLGDIGVPLDDSPMDFSAWCPRLPRRPTVRGRAMRSICIPNRPLS
jgi:transglutaminase-like putative cysteine protease